MITDEDERYDNPTLDKLDGLIENLGFVGAAIAVDGGTVHLFFNFKTEAQKFGRLLRDNGFGFEEITIREREYDWVMTADVRVEKT